MEADDLIDKKNGQQQQQQINETTKIMKLVFLLVTKCFS